MIKGYVSSDEDDYDDYDFGYSLTVEKKPECQPTIQTPEGREIMEAVAEESKIQKAFLDAVESGNLNVLETLISKGVEVDCTDSQGWSPLLKACGTGDFEVVELLLENGANPNKHRELLTPLMTCCTHTLVEEELKLNCVVLLLQHGAEVNAKDKFQTTALMYAAGSGYGNIVTELLGVPGVNVNIQDRDGWTALFHAVNNNNVKVVEKLMAVGSDLKLKDKFGRTVISLALDKNLKKIAKVLGFVEETTKPKKKKNPKDMFLNNLPNLKGEGGFCDDARRILFAFNQFKVKKISLPDLLNATDEDLYKIGVKLKPDRVKILSKGIHRYHLYPWKNSSMHQIIPGGPLNLEDVVAAAGTIAKNLTVVNASLRYLNTRICSRRNKDLIDLTQEQSMINFLINTYKYAESLQGLLLKIQKHTKQIKTEIPPDFIYPYQKQTHKSKLAKCFWYAVTAATVGFFIYY